MTDSSALGFAYEIDRAALRANVGVVTSSALAGGPWVLRAPVLCDRRVVALACESATKFLVAQSFDASWVDLLRRAWLDETSARTLTRDDALAVVRGFRELSSRARPPPLAICPTELLDAWSVLSHFGPTWLSAANVDAIEALPSGRDVFTRVRSRSHDVPAPSAFAHHVGGRSARALPKCSCGATFDSILTLASADLRVGLGDRAPAPVELLFCRACDIVWRAPLLAYAIDATSFSVIAQPAACRNHAIAAELPAAAITIAERDAASVSRYRIGGSSGTHACPRCTRSMRTVASMPSDLDVGIVLDDDELLEWHWCGECCVVVAEVVGEG